MRIIKRAFLLFFWVSCSNKEESNNGNIENIPNLIKQNDITLLKGWNLDWRYENAILMRYYIDSANWRSYILSEYEPEKYELKLLDAGSNYVHLDTNIVLDSAYLFEPIVFLRIYQLFKRLHIHSIQFNNKNDLIYFVNADSTLVYRCDTSRKMDKVILKQINVNWYRNW